MTHKTVVITTSEQAQLWLDHFAKLKVQVRQDDYASERARPIVWLGCTCCGSSYQGRQWWNQDTGYGLGDCCVDMCGANREPNTETESYGVSGIHFLTKGETDEKR